MLTVTPITMMIQAEEQAKRLEQNTRMLAEDMQRMTPSRTSTSHWAIAIGHFVARLRHKVLSQQTVITYCVEKHSCTNV